MQAPSIMSNGTSLTDVVRQSHQLDPYTMAAIGWQDSDHNGIMDVLDVPFTLPGSGQYNATTSTYVFSGSSHVNTLPNRNSSGTRRRYLDQPDQRGRRVDDDGGQWRGRHATGLAPIRRA